MSTKFLVSWLEENAAEGVSFSKMHISTFKSKHGIILSWNFRGAGHGKDDADPEFGQIKALADFLQLQTDLCNN